MLLTHDDAMISSFQLEVYEYESGEALISGRAGLALNERFPKIHGVAVYRMKAVRDFLD
jgi:hypothetical protein